MMSEPLIPGGREPLSSIAREVFASALAGCAIPEAVASAVRVDVARDGLTTLWVGEHALELNDIRRIRILAAGKAAVSMLEALLPILPAQIERGGIVVAPASRAELPGGFQFFAGGHPVPNEASFAAARATLAMLEETRSHEASETLCLFLISGGASAMLELPFDPAISLEDTIAFHRALVHSGASIAEINCVRKHFSAVKGGRLAALVNGAACISIFVSDVPQGREDAIGSGPTVPDSTTSEDCRATLARYRLIERFPASVRRYFSLGRLVETPKPRELAVRTLVLLDSGDLAEAARRHAERLGFHAVIDNTCDDWDYRAAADYLLTRLRVLRRIYSRVCLISVGEVTVESSDTRLLTSGIGGRNQQFALYAATRIESSDVPIAVLSAGSDGIDGSSAAAGAAVDHETLHSPRVRAAAQDALQQFRSTAFLHSIGATIMTGRDRQ